MFKFSKEKTREPCALPCLCSFRNGLTPSACGTSAYGTLRGPKCGDGIDEGRILNAAFGGDG